MKYRRVELQAGEAWPAGVTREDGAPTWYVHVREAIDWSPGPTCPKEGEFALCSGCGGQVWLAPSDGRVLMRPCVLDGTGEWRACMPCWDSGVRPEPEARSERLESLAKEYEET